MSDDYLDGSSEHTSDGDTAVTEGEDSCKVLVIPEKASSFSIHPGRLCKDECSYCFGKFGLFDTPCHIAQMKSVERQDRILATEKHLTRDSCLCDACYRHVDRKSNTPSYTNKLSKRSSIVAPGPRQNYCHVLGCTTIASNILRRKWIIKMRKNVCQVINIDLDNPGLHSIPICEEHFAALEHLMVCAMCKRRLARNHIHYLGPEVNDLNDALMSEGVPIKLSDKPIVCKLCRYFATLILKPTDDRPENSIDFFKDYKRRLLHFNDLEVMDGAAAEEPIAVPTKEKDQLKKKKRVHKNQTVVGPQQLEHNLETEKHDLMRIPSESTSSSNDKSRSESPTEYMVDYNTLVPSIAMECGSDIEIPRKDSVPKNQVSSKRVPRPESIKEAVEISKNMKLSSSNVCIKTVGINAVQRLGTNPSISVRQLFPGEEELGLQANIEFNNVKERTPEGWEKCISTIQYDLETKQLWQDLQKPYGNLSSFLRHLILLEKYYRNGDLVLSANATSHSINYSESVQNRLRAYDNIPTNTSMLINIKRSSSGIITTKEQPQTITHTINAANIPKNIPITLSQITSLSTSIPTAVPTTAALASTKQRNPGLPPGLISLHPGTTKPVAPLVKVPQTQKIKIPLTKNWRPNLIPIDPNKKPEKDKKIEYVKVISGGKPYHITLEDYHRICAIKRSCDLKQKRLQEAAKVGNQGGNSVLKQVYTTIRKTASISKSSKNEPLPPDGHEVENSLKKLDETVEKLESKLSEPKSAMVLPKIPKSLTVIPQTVSRKSSSPITQVTQKNKNVPSRTSS
ncbi:uncharacterized protein LOC108734572 [Agrilus planipennis]|uniref:Uncharacterized protein LOC108734572 n=1 Tax=Agrilus planipennis TaxID=224129 RepID=A0A1W4WCJ0_AGRPL|nr:uncharacterized protein LOC108734572 [Agrilus planipennis]